MLHVERSRSVYRTPCLSTYLGAAVSLDRPTGACSGPVINNEPGTLFYHRSIVSLALYPLICGEKRG